MQIKFVISAIKSIIFATIMTMSLPIPPLDAANMLCDPAKQANCPSISKFTNKELREALDRQKEKTAVIKREMQFREILEPEDNPAESDGNVTDTRRVGGPNRSTNDRGTNEREAARRRAEAWEREQELQRLSIERNRAERERRERVRDESAAIARREVAERAAERVERAAERAADRAERAERAASAAEDRAGATSGNPAMKAQVLISQRTQPETEPWDTRADKCIASGGRWIPKPGGNGYCKMNSVTGSGTDRAIWCKPLPSGCCKTETGAIKCERPEE